MEKAPISNTFGRYLKAIREQKGISLNAVADVICVGLWQLALIEAEDHERLPDEVYVKGILRAYAKAIGVDPDDIIDRYRSNLNAYELNARAEADILRSGKRSLPRMLLALGVLAAIVCGSLYSFYAFTENGTGSGFGSSLAAESQADPLAEAAAYETVLPPPVNPVQYAPGRLSLMIEVVSETIINVQVDDQKYTKYRLEPNDEVQLEASRRFNLLISDADGVRLRLNGQPVHIPGESGQSVNLVLTQRDGHR